MLTMFAPQMVQTVLGRKFGVRIQLSKGRLQWRIHTDSFLRARLQNPVELDGLRAAHVRDAVALVQFIEWLDNEARAQMETFLPSQPACGKLDNLDKKMDFGAYELLLVLADFYSVI